MSVTFNGTKLLQTIILNEKRVAEFYRQLSTEMEGKGSKVFELLAKDEDRHEKIYSNLLKKLPNNGDTELTVEDAEYINLLIENNMLSAGEDLLKSAHGKYAKEDALIIAEKIERDGIMLVNELKSLYPDLAPDEINKILAEERKHLKAVLSKQADAAVKLLML